MMDDIFGIAVSPIELILRGTLIYWFVFLAYRFLLRRGAGEVGFADIMLLVLIADASSNAMSGSYETVTEGVILVGTLIAWNWLIDTASIHSKWLERLLEPPPVLLIRHGRILHKNLRKERLTLDDLNQQIRVNGYISVTEIKCAYFEGDGTISIVPYR